MFLLLQKGLSEIVDRGDQGQTKGQHFPHVSRQTSRVLQASLLSQKLIALPALADSNILGWGSIPDADDSSTNGPTLSPLSSPNRSGSQSFSSLVHEYHVTLVKCDPRLQYREFKPEGKDRSWVFGDPSFNKL